MAKVLNRLGRCPARWVLFLMLLVPPAKPAVSQVAGSTNAPGADLFKAPMACRLRIELGPAELDALRRAPRESVAATVREGDKVYSDVSIHVKGERGSLRSVDDKPSLTVNFGRREAGALFHGLRKIHLNNSVEDPSYLHEYVGNELFRAAGVPAPRTAWAIVHLNNRRLGLYVLKEGFTEQFLGVWFTRTDGNLYDIGVGRDVQQQLVRDLGSGPDDQADLKALAAAAQEPDLARRWGRLGQVLDTNRFVSFMAMEVMVGHRDGYSLAVNNYRLYHDPESDRLIFFPHGMDQLFGKADAPWRPDMSGLVARAVMETAEGRRLYRERFGTLLTNVFFPADILRRVDTAVNRLRPALESEESRGFAEQARGLQHRIVNRRSELGRQFSQPELAPLTFREGVARLDGWYPVDVPAQGGLDKAPARDGRGALHFKAGPTTAASWRTRVILSPGRYRLEAEIQLRGVKPLPFGRNKGAGLRLGNRRQAQPFDFTGDAPWTSKSLDFDVRAEAEEIEVICELRASAGEAWFDLDRLRLTKVP